MALGQFMKFVPLKSWLIQEEFPLSIKLKDYTGSL